MEGKIGGQKQASSVSILYEGLEGTAWERSFYLDSAAKLSGNWNLGFFTNVKMHDDCALTELYSRNFFGRFT
jgi:hypothetical protein